MAKKQIAKSAKPGGGGKSRKARAPILFWNWAALLYLLSGYWFLSATAPGRTNDFAGVDILLIGALTAVVLCAQTVGLFALSFFVSRRVVVAAAFGLTAAVNFYFLFLVVGEWFWTASPMLQFFYCAPGAIILVAVFVAAEKFHRWKVAATVAASVLFLFSLAPHLAGAAIFAGEAKTPVIGGVTSSAKIRVPAFRQKPNVYFLSFDGMAAGAFVDKHLNAGQPAYEKMLRRHGFRRLKNHFSPGAATRESFGQLLALDADYYFQHVNDSVLQSPFAGSFGMWSGALPSPLFEIFKANGYAVRTFAYDHYMGGRQGPHIDEFIKYESSSACAAMRGAALFRGFFRYCPLLLSAYQKDWFGIRADGWYRHDGLYQAEDLTRLQNAVGKTAASKQPTFFISYLAIPGHTMSPYDVYNPASKKQYRAHFVDGDKKTAAAIDALMKTIKQNDPDAVVYIFGDHGVNLRRGMKWEKLQTEKEKRFFIQDAFAVVGAVYPATVCGDSFASPFSKTHITGVGVARHIIRCFSGEDIFIGGGEDHSLHRTYYKERYPVPGGHAAYLYE